MRYIDADALYKKIFPFDLVDPKLYTMHAKAVANAIDNAPTADVAPKSEVERLENTYNRAIRKIDNKTITAIRNAKQEVAREIFEEIEKAHNECIWIDITTRIGYLQQTKFENKLAELKKKYTEGREWTETNI